MDSPVTTTDVTILSVVFASVACLLTAIRLFERWRTRRLWWDDACASCSMLGLVALIVSTEIHYSSSAATYGTTVGVSSYYGQAFSFYIVVWTARLAILLTIVRIMPTVAGKRILTGVAGIFVIILCVLFAQELWICESNKAWKESTPPPQCPLGLQSAITQLTTDAVSDLIIVIVPLRLLAHSHISFQHRVRLMAIFLMSVATTIVSIVHAAYLIKVVKIAVVFSAIIEAGVSLIVCNLAVLVPAVVRLLSRDRGDTEPPRSTEVNAPSVSRTSVPLPETVYSTERYNISFGDKERGDVPRG